MTTIPVIDLFAGPGGMGEGFSAHAGQTRFNVALSVEKDPDAHRTLMLRSFFRQFPRGSVPDDYYWYVRDRSIDRDELFRRYPQQAAKAASIAWKAELGKEPYANVLNRIAEALNGQRHWALLGGPPCQAYSLIGRARMKSMEAFADDHRHTLYREYLKMVAAFQPTVFVMENVKGILSSKHNDEAIFGRILGDLRDPWAALSHRDRTTIPTPGSMHRYRVYSFSSKCFLWDEELQPSDYIIESERYGIPQRRHRVILFGIRADYDILPPVLEEAAGLATVRHVLERMPAIRSRLSRGDTDTYRWRAAVRRGASVCSSNSASRFRGLGTAIRNNLKAIPPDLGVGGAFVSGGGKASRLANWLHDPRLGGMLQHEARSHMESDLHRYLFASSYAMKYGAPARLDEFPKDLLPAHENAVIGEDGKVADFRDRFRVQLWDEPASTITAHMAKDGHYFIHPDPIQCRSLTVREAARLQTFPDSYFFEGNRTAQYTQVGNAVPPFLAYQLADIVAEVVENCIDQDARATRKSIRKVGMAAGG